jgi:hypothetical protein
MPEESAPSQSRVGGDYKEGTNPAPGGATDVDDVAPPYEGRTAGREDDVRGAGASVERQLAGVDRGPGGTASPAVESPARDEELTDDVPDSAHGVGVSRGDRGEDMIDRDGKEPGRRDGPREHPADRPTGTSDERDQSGI